jgi:hypothetical protein
MLNSLDLSKWREWLNRLIQLANQMVQGSTYSEEDHLGFMALCFVSKQIDHAISVLGLIPRRDAILIARSMIEGLVQLLWAAKDPDVLPLKWRQFAWVHDWRLMREKIARGEVVDEEQRLSIEGGLRQFGEQFLTPKGRKARDRGTKMPADPYHSNWRCGQQIRHICESVEGDVLYKGPYARFSGWHHWDAEGLGQTIDREGTQVFYSSLSERDSISAIATAFQCLFQTAEIVNGRLALGFGPKLVELRESYLAAHQQAGAVQSP